MQEYLSVREVLARLEDLKEEGYRYIPITDMLFHILELEDNDLKKISQADSSK